MARIKGIKYWRPFTPLLLCLLCLQGLVGYLGPPRHTRWPTGGWWRCRTSWRRRSWWRAPARPPPTSPRWPPRPWCRSHSPPDTVNTEHLWLQTPDHSTYQGTLVLWHRIRFYNYNKCEKYEKEYVEFSTQLKCHIFVDWVTLRFFISENDSDNLNLFWMLSPWKLWIWSCRRGWGRMTPWSRWGWSGPGCGSVWGRWRPGRRADLQDLDFISSGVIGNMEVQTSPL